MIRSTGDDAQAIGCEQNRAQTAATGVYVRDALIYRKLNKKSVYRTFSY